MCVATPLGAEEQGEMAGITVHAGRPVSYTHLVIFLSIGLVDKVQQALLAGGAYTPDLSLIHIW